jgi:proteic killer suppression protein
MILGFRSKEAEKIWHGEVTKRLPPAIQIVARRKLRMLNSARRLDDLRIPPANRLEALKGERKGQYSIRINEQWRLCFRWTEAGPADVEIVDYH